MITSLEFFIAAFILGLCAGSFCMTIIWGVCDKRLAAAYDDYIQKLKHDLRAKDELDAPT